MELRIRDPFSLEKSFTYVSLRYMVNSEGIVHTETDNAC